MPAPKAVLRDIYDQGLDPAVPYSRISSDGRLAHHVPSKEVPPKPALVKLPETKSLAPAPPPPPIVKPIAPVVPLVEPEKKGEVLEMKVELKIDDVKVTVEEKRESESDDSVEVEVLASSKKLKGKKPAA